MPERLMSEREEKRGAHPQNRGKSLGLVLPSLKICARATGSDGRLTGRSKRRHVKNPGGDVPRSDGLKLTNPFPPG